MILLPRAVAEGWTIAQFSEATGLSYVPARKMLIEASEKVSKKVDRELGVLVSDLREAARSAIPETVSQCQRALGVCGRILGVLESEIQAAESMDAIDSDDEDEDEPKKRKRGPLSGELAGSAVSLSRAMATLGATIKDLTGLKAAETIGINRAKEQAKKQNTVDPWATDFEVLDMVSPAE